MSYVLHYAPDNASLIIRLALEEMRLPYQTRLVDRQQNAQTSAAYLRLNPAGHIPCLETPDGPVSETAAILLWLSETHGKLAPCANAPDRGAFLKWMLFLSNTLQAGLRMTFYPEKYIGPDARDQTSLRLHMQSELARHLQLLETEAQAGHDWFGGAQVTVFDYYLAACLRWCALYPEAETGWFRLPNYPALHRLALLLENRPAVRAAQTAEGLGPTPFSAPCPARPPEGSAT